MIEVSKVKIVYDNSLFSVEQEVNRYLDMGYVILRIEYESPKIYGGNSTSYERRNMIYHMGLPKTEEKTKLGVKD